MVLAHIAGIPVEETALSFGPVLLVAGGAAGMQIRGRLRDGKSRILRLRRRPGRSEEGD
jgi:hypothetical protein